ncbi:plexin domain containing lethal (1) G0289 [Halictus rubicundus]|uniref:plexin domain containing lethal (1) G0289 n=1 Tax=Halictus rubicundus TaxID=77578 RepID=UPI00403612B0
MACERWCFNRGCDGAVRGWSCALLLIALYALEPGVADNEFNLYYQYDVGNSRGHSLAEDRSIELSFVSDNEEQELERERRAADDRPLDTPTTAASSFQQSTSEQPKPQPQPQQQSEQQQPQQQPPQQQQQQPEVAIDTRNTPANVSYSTDTGESSTVASAPTTSKSKQDNTNVIALRQSTANATKARGMPVVSIGRVQMSKVWTNATERTPEAGKTSAKVSTETTSEATDDDDEADTNIGDISIEKFSDLTNKTLLQHNITKMENDTHQYYNSTFIINEITGKKYWVDMDNHPDLKVNHLLSQSHRRATTVKLKFDFPFYGHKVRNITIATGGFLYTGEYVHSWLAATQYIAPLMANFDTRMSNESFVKYADNGTAFTVEWEKVILHDKPDAGPFTFQVTLHQNGNIVFVYSVIPLMVKMIEDTAHPVKVGLSDAYIMDRIVFFVRRKTIYEYHRVNFNRQDIQNWTVIYLSALPTCLEIDNCKDCLTKLNDFDCKWCSLLNQCSTGTFRSRQDWLSKGCEVKKIKDVDFCPLRTTTYKEHEEEFNHMHMQSEETVTVREMSLESILKTSRPSNMNMGVSGIIGILMVIGLVVGLVGWGAYAYRNPHSASGQMLIRYRPSQWSWRRGEARYTAATIHM